MTPQPLHPISTRPLRGRLVGLVAAVMALAAVAGPGVGPASASSPADLAYGARAQAAPIEALPGQGDTPIGPRFTSSRAVSENPPQTGYGLAAAVDVGLTESFTGPVGPRAEVDSTTTDIPNEDDASVGVSTYRSSTDGVTTVSEAVSDRIDAGTVTASSAWSRTSTSGAGDAVVAEARTGVSDVVVGPLTIEAVTSVARVVAAPDAPAAGSGSFTISGAEIAGVPVVLGVGGIDVDTARVPASQVDDARDQVTAALSVTPFFELRVAGPVVEQTQRGARVRSGALLIEMSSGPDNGNYFVRQTIGLSTAEAFVGGEVTSGFVAPEGAAPVDEEVAGVVREQPAPVVSSPVGDGRLASPGPAVSAPPSGPEVTPRTELLAASDISGSAALPGQWSGRTGAFAVLLVLAALAALTAMPVVPWHAAADRAWSRLADGYLRG